MSNATSLALPTPAHPLLDALWTSYAADVPYAATFASLAGGAFENDHVAFRSLARPGSGIDMFAGVFEALGWRRAGVYQFPDVHLRAVHLVQPGLPRVFVSELDPTAFDAPVQDALARLPADPPPPVDDLAALLRWFSAPSGDDAPAAADLDRLADVSPYGAWLLAFGRRVNHFTGAVADVEAWQQRMRDAGVPMKEAIEGAPGTPLRQTATHAARLDVVTRDGATRRMSYAYFEIAERRAGFDGFLAPQARQLFDMTS